MRCATGKVAVLKKLPVFMAQRTMGTKAGRQARRPQKGPKAGFGAYSYLHKGYMETLLPLQAQRFAGYMRWVERLGWSVGVNVKVEEDEASLKSGDIFLFNHFTRLETLLPPYLIFKATGALSRSVAHHDLFEVNGRLAKVLREAGGVPNNMPGLLPFLAREVLRGRKVIIFPEGGMVKDRKVVDAQGNVSIYSPERKMFRKQHRGAAVLALTLDLIKYRLRQVLGSGDEKAIKAWCDDLELSREELWKAAEKPTTIVPGNITYYPVRTGENVLTRGFENLFPKAPRQALEEVLIESNLLFNPTDMDVRFNPAMPVLRELKWADRTLLDKALQNAHTVEDFFALHENAEGWGGYYVKRFLEGEIERLREEYARTIYKSTTININHLVSALVMFLAEQGRMEVKAGHFHKALYLALKELQGNPQVNLHCSLARPENYRGLSEGESAGFNGFIGACARARLLRRDEDAYHLSYRLFDVHDFHQVRLENPVQVHANEAAPVPQVRKAVERAYNAVASGKVFGTRMVELWLDDEVREYRGQRVRFGKRAPQTLVNAQNPANGEPYLLVPSGGAHTGVLLVHGFNASPGELRPFAEFLQQAGYAVMGVRLPGHGTSHLEMEQRTRAEWAAAVLRGHKILSGHVQKVAVVGFSTGAALGLELATHAPDNVLGIASVAAPMFVRDGNIRWLPLVARLSRMLRWVPGLQGVLRYYPFVTDKPESNYSTVPVAALNELRLLIKQVAYGLRYVTLPVLLMQGRADETVQPSSAEYIFRHLVASPNKQLRWVEKGPHGLIAQNVGPTWAALRAFVERLERGEETS